MALMHIGVETLQPLDARALCAGLLARGSTMKPPAYKPLKTLRFWKTPHVGDVGAAAVAELLKDGKGLDLLLEGVELMDCGIGPVGCRALGNSLILGGNTSLLSLKLELNLGLGDEGARELARGLRTNRTLKQLSLNYCDIGPAGAEALAEVLASPIGTLESVSLLGNRLGSLGLLSLAVAAHYSKTLKELILKDNGIGAGSSPTLAIVGVTAGGGPGPAAVAAAVAASGGAAGGAGAAEKAAAAAAGMSLEGSMEAPSVLWRVALREQLSAFTTGCINDQQRTQLALRQLGKALLLPPEVCGLCRVDLELNTLSAEEVAVLPEYVSGNLKVELFKVDATLPPELFAALCKIPAPAKGGKKKGKKK